MAPPLIPLAPAPGTFGNNELLGGDVRSTLTVNLPCEKLTVSAGDTIILDGGRYCVGEQG